MRTTAEDNEGKHGINYFTSNDDPPVSGSRSKDVSIIDIPSVSTARINVPATTSPSPSPSPSSTSCSLVSRMRKKLSYYQYRMDTYYLPPKRKLKVQIFFVGGLAVFNIGKFFQHLHDRPQNAFAFIFTTCVLVSCLYILYSVGYESLAEQYVAYYTAKGYQRESSGEGEEKGAVMCSSVQSARATAACEQQGVGTSQQGDFNGNVRAHTLIGEDKANNNGRGNRKEEEADEEIDYEKFNITTNIDNIYRMLRSALTFRGTAKDAAGATGREAQAVLPIISRSSDGVPIVTRITLSSPCNDTSEGTSLSSATEMVVQPYPVDLATCRGSRNSGVESADGRSVVDARHFPTDKHQRIYSSEVADCSSVDEKKTLPPTRRARRTHIAEDMASNPRHPSNSSLIRRYPDALMNISIACLVFVVVMCLYYLYVAVTEGALSSSSSEVDGGRGGADDAPPTDQKLTLTNFDASNYMVSALYFSCKKWFVAVYLYMRVVKKENVLVKEALLKLVADEEDEIENEGE